MTAEQELDPARWRKRDANDIAAECIWLSYGLDDISVHHGSASVASGLLDVCLKRMAGGFALFCFGVNDVLMRKKNGRDIVKTITRDV